MGNNINNWAKNCYEDTGNNVVGFVRKLENYPEANLMSFRLISLAVKI